MSLERTPPGSKSIRGSESASGSVPNLSTHTDESYINVNLRKRKERSEEQDFTAEFKNFRNEIMGFLQDFGKTQTENLKSIRDEIVEIKNEITEIKLSTENFTQQFNHIDKEIENIKMHNNETREKITQLETEILMMKNKNTTESSTTPSATFTNEEIFVELKERCEREKNIIISGISEETNTNTKERRISDTEEVMKIINLIIEDCAKPIKCIRLGKFIPNKNRPIKVFFRDSNTPKSIFRNKGTLPENIKIYADYTPTQQQHWQLLKNELKNRTEAGEKGLIIKYVKGIPRIVTNCDNTKN